MSVTQTYARPRTLTITPYYYDGSQNTQAQFSLSAQQSISSLCTRLRNGNEVGTIFVGLDLEQIEASGSLILEDVVPPGYSELYAIIQYPKNLIQGQGGRSNLELEKFRLEMQRTMEDRIQSERAAMEKLMSEKIQEERALREEAIREERQLREQAVQEERVLRELADAKLQACLESETLERQSQNLIVANALAHQASFGEFTSLISLLNNAQDTTLLCQIWFEDLLRRTQTKLAISANLPRIRGEYLFAWRHFLDQVGESTVDRRNHARAILPLVPKSATLVASDQAMDILCMKKIGFRLGGSNVRLPSQDNVIDNLGTLRAMAQQHSDVEVKKGLLDIIDFDLSIR